MDDYILFKFILDYSGVSGYRICLVLILVSPLKWNPTVPRSGRFKYLTGKWEDIKEKRKKYSHIKRKKNIKDIKKDIKEKRIFSYYKQIF